jgi:hypothetical protein
MAARDDVADWTPRQWMEAFEDALYSSLPVLGQ